MMYVVVGEVVVEECHREEELSKWEGKKCKGREVSQWSLTRNRRVEKCEVCGISLC